MQIENLTLFHGLSKEETKRSMVCSSAKIETYEQDAYIFRQEDQPSRLYFILSGTVLLGQINALGRQNFIEYLGEGQGFGEIDLFLEHDIYDYFAFAKTEVKLLSVSRHFFYGTCVKNCAHHSRIIFNMLRIFAGEADKNLRKIYLLTSGNLRQRIAGYLLEESQGKAEVVTPMKREELAVYLNTTRPSLSRELSWMQENGIIERNGRQSIRILSFEMLQNILEGEE